MPVITPTTEEADRTQFQKPQSAASTCLTHCLYAIPPVLITVALPGLSILVTGLVLVGLAVTAAETSNRAEGLRRNAVVIVGVGGAWTVLVIGFWVMSCCRHRPSTGNKADTGRRDRTSSVELVSVSWRDDRYSDVCISRDQFS